MSVARASHAVAMVRMSAIVLFCFDRCIAVKRFGMAIAAKMPMIATTISSSMRVKPFCLFIDPPYFVETDYLYRNRDSMGTQAAKSQFNRHLIDWPKDGCDNFWRR